MVRWLRLESIASLAAVLLAYHACSGQWKVFFYLLLLPDLSLLGFIVNAKLGSIAYNVLHSLILPATMAAIGCGLPNQQHWLPLSLIWMAHIHMDRSLGYGLKKVGTFQETHLGKIGSRKRVTA